MILGFRAITNNVKVSRSRTNQTDIVPSKEQNRIHHIVLLIFFIRAIFIIHRPVPMTPLLLLMNTSSTKKSEEELWKEKQVSSIPWGKQ